MSSPIPSPTLSPISSIIDEGSQLLSQLTNALGCKSSNQKESTDFIQGLSVGQSLTFVDTADSHLMKNQLVALLKKAKLEGVNVKSLRRDYDLLKPKIEEFKESQEKELQERSKKGSKKRKISEDQQETGGNTSKATNDSPNGGGEVGWDRVLDGIDSLIDERKRLMKRVAEVDRLLKEEMKQGYLHVS